MENRWSFCALALFVCLCESATAAVYQVTNLGVLTGGTFSGAQSINNNGQITGTSEIAGGLTRAFLYSGGVMQDLGVTAGQNSSVGNAINSSGHVAGSVNPNGFSAVLYDGTLHTIGNDSSNAFGLNDNDEAVGRSTTTTPSRHAVLFKNGTTQDLGALGTGKTSLAYGINSAGTIVGVSAISAAGSLPEHAFVYSSGVMHDLGTLGGQDSTALAINDAGQITGGANVDAGAYHAFLYDNGVMHDLGSLGGFSANGIGINSAGDIGGQSLLADNATNHAFLYHSGVMQDLNSLIDPASGWVLNSATDINDAGQIVGSGLFNGQQRGFILTPVPEPSTYALTAVGIVALLAIKQRQSLA